MHQLEMPFALAGLQIDRDQALAEQRIAWTFAAVVVGAGASGGDEYEVIGRIGRDEGT